MLVSFSVANWLSYKDRVELSMVASKERQHGGRVPKFPKYDTRLLPVAALYGGNASGKSNFFKAISFAKNFIVLGTRPGSVIPVKPYSLDKDNDARPTEFEFVLCADDTFYEYSFSATRNLVLAEKLVKITSRSEITLFRRTEDHLELHKSLKDKDFLRFAFRGTRSNQLFLTNASSQNIDLFKPVYNWFKDSLVLLAPDSRFAPFDVLFSDSSQEWQEVNSFLPLLDTGITKVGVKDVPIETLNLPSSVLARLEEELHDGAAAKIHSGSDSRKVLIFRESGRLSAKELVTYHLDEAGQEVEFGMPQESDGTRRVIELLPAFFELIRAQSQKVIVIDEIDRSLHSMMVSAMVERYLESCHSRSRSQLLFTTHDLQLMDQKLLRRDEMWLVERNIHGVSTVFSFGDFEGIRYDKDIRKSYLQGRFGGLPRLLLDGTTDQAIDRDED